MRADVPDPDDPESHSAAGLDRLREGLDGPEQAGWIGELHELLHRGSMEGFGDGDSATAVVGEQDVVAAAVPLTWLAGDEPSPLEPRELTRQPTTRPADVVGEPAYPDALRGCVTHAVQHFEVGEGDAGTAFERLGNPVVDVLADALVRVPHVLRRRRCGENVVRSC